MLHISSSCPPVCFLPLVLSTDGRTADDSGLWKWHQSVWHSGGLRCWEVSISCIAVMADIAKLLVADRLWILKVQILYWLTVHVRCESSRNNTLNLCSSNKKQSLSLHEHNLSPSLQFINILFMPPAKNMLWLQVKATGSHLKYTWACFSSNQLWLDVPARLFS